jgi:GH24 family phage-related lysozyme (muramidase)
MKTNTDGLKLIASIKRPAMPLAEAEWVVDASVKVSLHPNQFAALVSFVSCRGEGAFLRSTLLKYVNADMHFHAAKEFARFNRQAGRVRPTLTQRRAKERELYMTPCVVAMNGG